MRYGFHVPHVGPLAKPENLARIATEAEAAGFESVWVSDHVVLPTTTRSTYPNNPAGRLPMRPSTPILEPIVTMGYLAAVTRTVRIGVSVLVIPYRQPVLLGKLLSTVDVLSNGRLILGAGVGWLAEEFEALGAPPVNRRGRATDEYLEALKVLWTEADPSYAGQIVRFGDFKIEPKPVQQPHPPIWIGGHSPAALNRVVRLGDGYHASRRSPSQLKALNADLDRALEAAGRDAGSVPRSMRISIRLADAPANADLEGPDGAAYGLTGTADEVVTWIDRYHAAGCQKLVVETPSRDLDDVLRYLDRFRREVMARTMEGAAS